MPEQETLKRARRDAREGKSPSTQAGEFVREEIEHVREGKHGARSAKQAIAIGLSKARRAGVKLPPPRKGSASTRTQAARETRRTDSAHPANHAHDTDHAHHTDRMHPTNDVQSAHETHRTRASASCAREPGSVTALARSWLLRIGWRRHRRSGSSRCGCRGPGGHAAFPA